MAPKVIFSMRQRGLYGGSTIETRQQRRDQNRLGVRTSKTQDEDGVGKTDCELLGERL